MEGKKISSDGAFKIPPSRAACFSAPTTDEKQLTRKMENKEKIKNDLGSGGLFGGHTCKPRTAITAFTEDMIVQPKNRQTPGSGGSRVFKVPATSTASTHAPQVDQATSAGQIANMQTKRKKDLEARIFGQKSIASEQSAPTALKRKYEVEHNIKNPSVGQIASMQAKRKKDLEARISAQKIVAREQHAALRTLKRKYECEFKNTKTPFAGQLADMQEKRTALEARIYAQKVIAREQQASLTALKRKWEGEQKNNTSSGGQIEDMQAKRKALEEVIFARRIIASQQQAALTAMKIKLEGEPRPIKKPAIALRPNFPVMPVATPIRMDNQEEINTPHTEEQINRQNSFPVSSLMKLQRQIQAFSDELEAKNGGAPIFTNVDDLVTEEEEIEMSKWCVVCKKRSVLHCCGNATFCGTHCQEIYWPVHVYECTY